jgi:hypothetical protein
VRVGGGGDAGPLYAGLWSEGEPEAVGDGEGDVSTGRRLKLGIGQGVRGAGRGSVRLYRNRVWQVEGVPYKKGFCLPDWIFIRFSGGNRRIWQLCAYQPAYGNKTGYP